MVRDFAEFGYPNIYCDTSHVFLVTYRNLLDRGEELPKNMKPLIVRMIFAGQMVIMEYDLKDMDKAKACYEFLKTCIDQNEKR